MPSLNAIPPDAIRVVPDDLRTLTSDILCRPDLLHADARRIADCLVAVDLRGVVSHGTCQLRRYVKKIQARQINPGPQTHLIQETPVNAVFDGDGGAGYWSPHKPPKRSSRKPALKVLQWPLLTTMVMWVVAASMPGWPSNTTWSPGQSPPMCFAVPAAQGPPLVLDMNTTMFKGRDEVQNAMQTFPDSVFKSLGLPLHFHHPGRCYGRPVALRSSGPPISRRFSGLLHRCRSPRPYRRPGDLHLGSQPDHIREPEIKSPVWPGPKKASPSTGTTKTSWPPSPGR